MWACPACTLEQPDCRKQCILCLTVRPDIEELQRKLYSEPVKPKGKGKAKAPCDQGAAPNVPKARAPKRPLPAISRVVPAHTQGYPRSIPASNIWYDDTPVKGGAPPCILEAVAVEPEPAESDDGSDSTSHDAEATYELQLPTLKSKTVGKAGRVRLSITHTHPAHIICMHALLALADILFACPRRRSGASAQAWGSVWRFTRQLPSRSRPISCSGPPSSGPHRTPTPSP